jgi:predicted ATP-grasp superfamily ATP-dependent carboligase
MGGRALPCLGMSTAQVGRLRAPATFFGTLAHLGLAHPAVSLARPTDPAGWLAKRAGACGGAHVRDAAEMGRAGGPHADTFYQRFQAGVPMSALFVADGTRAVVVALNRQLVRAFGSCRHVYAGVVGPLDDAALLARVEQALEGLTGAFGLRGLASLDFIADGATPWLLEINPRPSASMELHADAWPAGLVQAHLRAVRGRLPDTPPRRATGVRGHRIVFADGACRIDAALAGTLARSPHCHDLPPAGARFAGGDPVCSVSAEGVTGDEVQRALGARAQAVSVRLAALAPASFGELAA